MATVTDRRYMRLAGQRLKKEVGWLGLEPRTNALKGHCSTD